MNRCTAVLTLWILCLGGAGGAQAQQLENAGFDADLQHWTDPGYSDRLLSWSSEDSAASLGSGSLLHVGDDTSGGVALGLEQCVDVQAGGTYQLAGEALVPSGQSGSIAPYIFLQEYDGDACDAYTGRYWATGPFLVEGTWGSFDGLEAELLSTESKSVMIPFTPSASTFPILISVMAKNMFFDACSFNPQIVSPSRLPSLTSSDL